MLSEYKAQARAALHDAMAEPASYTSPEGTVHPSAEQIEAGLSLTVRWHNKIKIIGENEQSDAAILEGINRLVFQAPQLEALGLVLKRSGIVDVPGYGKRFRLEYKEEEDGPLNVYWSVIEL